MHRTLRDVVMPHEDHVAVHPTHGAGSLCATGIASTSTSTIGYERRHNPLVGIADVEGVVVADRAVLVAKLGAGPDHVSGAGQGGEIAGARDVVVVEVGLDHVGDPDVQLAGRREVDVDVPARIDDCGDPGGLVGDEGRQVTEPFDPELADLHAAESTATGVSAPHQPPDRPWASGGIDLECYTPATLQRGRPGSDIQAIDGEERA